MCRGNASRSEADANAALTARAARSRWHAKGGRLDDSPPSFAGELRAHAPLIVGLLVILAVLVVALVFSRLQPVDAAAAPAAGGVERASVRPAPVECAKPAARVTT